MTEKKVIAVRVREAKRKDIPALMELNRLAYPKLATDNVVWGEAHLLGHLRVFPQGQQVAEAKGKIFDTAAALIVDLLPDPLRHHTWAGITDSGCFTNHDSQGDTLYGADVHVHPDARELGVGNGLYAARRAARCVVSFSEFTGSTTSLRLRTPEEQVSRVPNLSDCPQSQGFV